MPWNFPWWQVIRAAIPAILAGNTVILKHSPNVSGCSEAIAAFFEESALPAHVFQSIFVSNEVAGQVIADRRIAGVTFTGSTRGGKQVAAQAGAHLKKCVLELGGSDPYIVLDDADIAAAAKCCVASRMVNNGQSCIAAKRFIITKAHQAEFEEAVVTEMQTYALVAPLEDRCTLGPMARGNLRDELHRQVERSIAAGARCLLGGQVPDRAGFWYPATVLTGVTAGMPAYTEELFGPCASILPVANEAEALRVANDTVYGLGGAIFSRDEARARTLAHQSLCSGSVGINSGVRSDPRLPFGGIKESGIGREMGREGIHEFVNIQTIVVY